MEKKPPQSKSSPVTLHVCTVTSVLRFPRTLCKYLSDASGIRAVVLSC